jgi:hypothetical protein
MRLKSTTAHQQLIALRRQKVLEYMSTGYTNHREIARILNVDHVTIDRDVRYLMLDCKADIRNHFESLPLEIKKCMIGLELTIRALTTIIDADATEPAHRLGALTTRMTAYRFRMDILDGKAQLDEVFAYMDAALEKQKQTGRGFNDPKDQSSDR